MPKVAKPYTPYAPPKDNGRLEQELFHLERTIANSDRMNADVTDSLQAVVSSVDNLTAAVESLTTTAEAIEDLLGKIVKVREGRT